MSDTPDQGLPDDGEDNGEDNEEGEGNGEGDEEEAPPAPPPLATDPVLTNAIDVPSLGRPVDASAAEAISSAHTTATQASS
jgi:hypothetical protein